MSVRRDATRLLVVLAICLICVPMPLQAADRAAQEADTVSLSGLLVAVWGDPQAPAGAGGLTQAWLFDPAPGLTGGEGAGDAVPLVIDPQVGTLPGSLRALNRQPVTVQGRWLGLPAPGTRFQVEAIQPSQAEPEPEVEAVVGSQPWVSLMCKFSDVPDEPRDLGYFEGMYSPTFPGLDHYWRQASYGRINLQGSMAAGWYTLPQPRSYYVYDNDGDGIEELDWTRAAEDCTGVADADVYFPQYVGINLMFNADLDCCAWGGSWWLDRDGEWKLYRMTWEPPWGYGNVGVIAHETGHGFGLPHSSGDYGQVYDNRWDVMSDVWTDCDNLTDPTYGCVGQGTIAYHLDLLDWVEASRGAVVPPGSQMTLTLERLQQPGDDGYLIAQIPIDGSETWFYTVEARQRVGYDLKLPAPGVVVHEVETSRPEPAHVVDVDGDGDTGDANFLPGQTFSDPGHYIQVSIDGATDTGYTVTISNRFLVPVHVHNLALRAQEKNGTYLIKAVVRIVDAERQVVPDAQVSAQWTLPDGQTRDVEAMTDAKGQAAFKLITSVQGRYELCVTGVLKPGTVYDPDQNRVTCRSVQLRP